MSVRDCHIRVRNKMDTLFEITQNAWTLGFDACVDYIRDHMDSSLLGVAGCDGQVRVCVCVCGRRWVEQVTLLRIRTLMKCVHYCSPQFTLKLWDLPCHVCARVNCVSVVYIAQ